MTGVTEAVLAYTKDKLDVLYARLAGGALKPMLGSGEVALGQEYFSFGCPECFGRVSVTPVHPEEVGWESGALGFAVAQCRTGRCDERIQRLIGEEAAPDTDLELIRIKRMRRGGEVRWLIPDVMERGTLASLFGPPGAGKSLLALEWAASVALTGLEVAYLDEENDPELMDERLEAMGHRPADLRGALRYFSFPGWNVDDPDGAQRLVDEFSMAGLVVFDSWAKFFGSSSQSDDAAANRAFRLTVRPLKERGVGILRLDHSSHENLTRPSGTIAKLADVDHNWQMKAVGLDGLRAQVSLVHRKSRTGRGPRTLNLIREVHPTLRHIRGAAEEDETAAADPVGALVDFMDERGWPTDWSSAATLEALKGVRGKAGRKDVVLAAMRVRKNRSEPMSDM